MLNVTASANENELLIHRRLIQSQFYKGLQSFHSWGSFPSRLYVDVMIFCLCTNFNFAFSPHINAL